LAAVASCPKQKGENTRDKQTRKSENNATQGGSSVDVPHTAVAGSLRNNPLAYLITDTDGDGIVGSAFSSLLFVIVVGHGAVSFFLAFVPALCYRGRLAKGFGAGAGSDFWARFELMSFRSCMMSFESGLGSDVELKHVDLPSWGQAKQKVGMRAQREKPAGLLCLSAFHHQIVKKRHGSVWAVSGALSGCTLV
jgi:hypothetical protein